MGPGGEKSSTVSSGTRISHAMDTGQSRLEIQVPRRPEPYVIEIWNKGFGEPRRLTRGSAGGQVEGHVDDHVLLATDQPAPADLDQDVAHVHAVGVGRPLAVP